MAHQSPDTLAALQEDLAGVFEILGNRHTMNLLWHLFRVPGPVTFSELRALTGVNPATLSSRLRLLEKEGFVERTPLHVIPRRVEYTLTPKTRAMSPIWRELMRWRSRYARSSPAPESRTRRSRQ